MMATNPRWRQPLRTWRAYFAGWVRQPDPMAQMLASVMFDLRPIGGEGSLFENLHVETLAMASANSIFVAHMVSNAEAHATAQPVPRLRHRPVGRAQEHGRSQAERRRAADGPRAHLRAAGAASADQHARAAAGGRGPCWRRSPSVSRPSTAARSAATRTCPRS
jgi:Putative nucleotidyltransferase DUF294